MKTHVLKHIGVRRHMCNIATGWWWVLKFDRSRHRFLPWPFWRKRDKDLVRLECCASRTFGFPALVVWACLC